jgi:hypothetical protein
MSDLRAEREKEIADIVATTALKVSEQSKRVSMFTDQLKRTSWWRFRLRRRLKRAIRYETGFVAMIGALGAAHVASVMSQPIKKVNQ